MRDRHMRNLILIALMPMAWLTIACHDGDGRTATPADAAGVNAQPWWKPQLPQHSATAARQKLNKDGKVNGWWTKMHERQLKLKNEMKDAQIIFVGASVIQYWTAGNTGGQGNKYQRGKKIWDQYYLHRKPLNFGIAGDNTATTLWRMQNGALEGINPKVAIVAIGHNNKELAQEIADGMLAVVREIHLRCPETTVLLMPYLPSTKKNWRNGKFFQAYDIACDKVKGDNLTIPLDINDALLNDEGILKDQQLVPDNLHPAEGGYRLWAEAMEPTLQKLLK